MRTFHLTTEQEQRVKEWDKCSGKTGDVTGGRLSYAFSPCSLGVSVRVSCHVCGEYIDLFEQMD